MHASAYRNVLINEFTELKTKSSIDVGILNCKGNEYGNISKQNIFRDKA